MTKAAVLKSGVLAAVLSGAAFAQTTLHTTTTLVVVPTLVETAGKELVFSLKADDFVLTDNGVPQKVMLEDASSRPLSLVLLMQTGGAARGQFPSFANLDTMIASILGPAPGDVTPNKVSVVNFDSRPEAASPFTSDVAQWKDAIDHPDAGNSGAAVFDGLEYAIGLLKQQPANMRRAILLISQEHDDGSHAKAKDVVRDLGETNTAVYSMTFSAEKTTLRQEFRHSSHPHPPITINPAAGSFLGYYDLSVPLNAAIGAMHKNMSAEIAALSGGETSSFDNAVELGDDLNVLNNHIRNRYILSFYPTSQTTGLHTIAVRLVHHPELLVSARRNYWLEAQP
ncbi:VWA domain-containing protein [Edaphobacter paludis]|uniref:VWA domain-containing protein n=1 Tax=Edaphobacter paludis TaxID=3035702 RepID=A0AAU7CXZ1_9BACT